jgi:hypothetical protein
MAFPFGRWVWIDLGKGEPLIAYVYLDQGAGPSAKGGPANDPNLATSPSHTVRLGGAFAIRELSAEDLRAHTLPSRPEWLRFYGPQPDPEAPWRTDPLLTFHADYPDDTQAFVHDGEPRRTRRPGEICWVRLQGVEPAPPRRLLVMEEPGPDYEPSPHVYIGVLLNQPHGLQSVKQGDRIKLVSVHGMPHPLHVTDEYLRERADWAISPCNKCGATEVFDPPSVMGKLRFPDLPPGSTLDGFSSFCTMCGGVQMLSHLSGARST